MKFDDTNATIYTTEHGYYAACKADGCTWVGPERRTPGVAKLDAIRHHESD